MHKLPFNINSLFFPFVPPRPSLRMAANGQSMVQPAEWRRKKFISSTEQSVVCGKPKNLPSNTLMYFHPSCLLLRVFFLTLCLWGVLIDILSFIKREIFRDSFKRTGGLNMLKLLQFVSRIMYSTNRRYARRNSNWFAKMKIQNGRSLSLTLFQNLKIPRGV